VAGDAKEQALWKNMENDGHDFRKNFYLTEWLNIEVNSLILKQLKVFLHE